MNKIQDTQPVRPLMGNERSIIEGEQAEAAASSEEAFSGRADASSTVSFQTALAQAIAKVCEKRWTDYSAKMTQ